MPFHGCLSTPLIPSVCFGSAATHLSPGHSKKSFIKKKNPKNLYPEIWDYLSSDNSTTFSISIWSHSVSGNSNDRLTTFNLIGVSKVITSDYNTRVQNRGHVQRSRWKLPTASEITTRRKIGKRTENYPQLMMQGELEEIMNNS